MNEIEEKLRDQFAETAMRELLGTIPCGSDVKAKGIAKSAYILADAMIKRRKK